MPAIQNWFRRLLPAPASAPSSPLRAGTRAYREHLAEEVAHYTGLYEGAKGDRERLMETSSAAWDDIHERAARRIEARTGRTMEGHILAKLAEAQSTRSPRLLSLGCGPGGIELALAREMHGPQFVGIDVNEDLLELGRRAAADEHLPVTFEAADLNTIELPPAEYDVVFCHASLHHILEMEHVVAQIRRTLRPDGELVVLDVITRSGYLMWPETRDLARTMFRTLPERLRTNHTAYAEPKPDTDLWEQDTREAGMECIRSEEIVPSLRANFHEVHFVPLHSLARRFFDSMYGPNYDLSRPLDRAIVDWVWALDCDALDTGRLKPETFFGIYHS